MNTTQTVRDYFSKLGLSEEIADIYLALATHGPLSISDLSRRSGVERTRIYRLMDQLAASNLVEVETQYKKSIFHAAPLANVQVLIAKKEQEVHDLQAELAALQQTLAPASLSSPATRIQTYQGAEGLKQMYWNQTRSTSENLSILYENMQIRTNLLFFERWVRACNERGVQFRSIIGDNFIASQNEWYGRHANERLANWQARYVSADTFPIAHSTVIYDDTTAYYNWKDGEVFGIEIHNQQIADAQRHFFEMLWSKGAAAS